VNEIQAFAPEFFVCGVERYQSESDSRQLKFALIDKFETRELFFRRFPPYTMKAQVFEYDTAY